MFAFRREARSSRGHSTRSLLSRLARIAHPPDEAGEAKLPSLFSAFRNPHSAFSCLILVGFVFLAILWVLNVVFAIIASIQAGDGKFYRYPMTIRFIQ